MATRVLLVEDDPTVRLILRRRLQAAGYEVLVAEDGRQALAMVKQERLSLVVSDWMMPEIDGLELCRLVKSDPELYPVYFIMMTAKGEKADCIEGLEAGADDYLSKPVDEGELLARLKAGQRVVSQQINLQSLASTDPLTGLRNRRSFEEDLETEMDTIRLQGLPFSLLLLDLDDFKVVNDQWGHARGDEALRVIGRFLLWTLRRSDRVYRIGGDEFAVILPHAKEAEAEKIVERLREDFATYFSEQDDRMPFELTFSIGCTTANPGAEIAREQLMQLADRNMYLDKKHRAMTRRENEPDVMGGQGTVMVVDDEPVTRRILEKGLTAAGYRVLTAEDGETCLEILRREELDVLIVDWIMPGVDGLEVCQSIRADERIKTPYMIVVTVMGGARSRIYALDSGADDFINKPIDMDELLARVRVGLRMERLKKQIARAEKLEGVIQMAGAVAHELSQPLTALLGMVDLLAMKLDPSDPNASRVRQIGEQANRLSDLTKKIGRIMKCETRDYLGDTKIVDIDKSSGHADPTDVSPSPG